MKKNLFVRYNFISVIMIIIGSCFTSAVIMYSISDFSEYSFLRSNVNVIMRNVFDEMEINSEQTFEKELKDNFKIVSDNTMRLVLFDQDKKILYSNLESKYADFIDFKHIANKLEHNKKKKKKKDIPASHSEPNKCYIYGRELSSYLSESEIKYLMILDFENKFTGIYNAINLKFIFSLFCFVCFSTIIFIIYTFYISKPLRKIKMVAQEYEKGNFEPKVKIKTKDEIGELAQTINKMSQSIAKFEESSQNFVSNVSHEFKTPITSISGFIDGILDGTVPEQKQTHYLRIVSSEVKRLSNLVHSMLNISRIESGGVRPAFVPLNISKIIKNIVKNFIDKIEAKDLRIKGINKFENCWIEGDEGLTYQVFYNLIENAIKFSNHGGYILFGIFRVSNFLTIRIQNSGKGLKEEEKERLFERFYKTDKSRSQDTSGVGLGLNIVLTIVRLCDWKIKVNSEYGKYTEFVLTVKSCADPKLDEPDEAHAPEQTPAESTNQV